jgi:alpha-1,2-mannosyltransferase
MQPPRKKRAATLPVDSTTSNRLRYANLVLVAATAVLLCVHLFFVNSFSTPPLAADYAKFYASARSVWSGDDVYGPVPFDAFGPLPDGLEAPQKMQYPNLNLPAFVFLSAPIGLGGYKTGYWILSLTSLACIFVSVWLTWREFREEASPLHVWVVLLLLVAYFPTWSNLQLGQVSLILLLLTVVIWLAGRREHDAVAGVALGLAIVLKTFTGLLILAFILTRRWRAVLYATMTFLVTNALALLALGPGSYRRYLEVLAEVTWYSASWNASFLGFLTRLFDGSDHLPLADYPRAARVASGGLTVVLVLGMVVLAWWMSRRRERSTGWPKEHWDLLFSYAVVGMLLTSPLGWSYYFPVLMIPAVVLWRLSSRGFSTRSQRWFRAGILAAWLMSTVPHRLLTLEELSIPANWFTWAGFPFYSLLLFAALIVIAVLHGKRDEVPEPSPPPQPHGADRILSNANR